MTKFFLALTTAISITQISSGWAAQATDTEADRLRGVFERYVGKSPDGRPARVTVTPTGQAYQVTFNLQTAVDSVLDLLPKTPKTQDLTIEIAPITVTIEPLTDGTWKVSQTDGIRVSYALFHQSGSVKSEGLRTEGIFDPALWGYRTATTHIDTLSSTSEAPNIESSNTEHDVVSKLTGAADTGGTVTEIIDTTTPLVAQSLQVKASPDPNVPMPQLSVTARSVDRHSHLVLQQLKAQEIMDLWAFLVANPTKEQLVSQQADLKTRLTSALPLFGQISGDGGTGLTVVLTDYGKGQFKSANAKVLVSNAAGANSLNVGLNVAGLTVDSVFVPAFAASLIPSDLDVNFSLKGYDLPAAAEKFIQDVDFSKPEPLSAEKKADLLKTVLPQGNLVYDLLPSSISAQGYKLSWFGIVEIRPQHAKLHIDVSATGIDTIIKSLQQVKQGSAASIVIGLYAAKALGKPGADGALNWAIDYEDGGLFLVNGSPVGPQKKI